MYARSYFSFVVATVFWSHVAQSEAMSGWIEQHLSAWPAENREELCESLTAVLNAATEGRASDVRTAINEAAPAFLGQVGGLINEYQGPERTEVVAEQFRLAIRDYLDRPAMNDAERQLAERQLEDILAHIRARTAEVAGGELDFAKSVELGELVFQAESANREAFRNPLMPSLKRPLTAKELTEIYASIDGYFAVCAEKLEEEVRSNARIDGSGNFTAPPSLLRAVRSSYQWYFYAFPKPESVELKILERRMVNSDFVRAPTK